MIARHLIAALAVFAVIGWLAAARDSVPHAATAPAGRFVLQDAGKTVLDRINDLRWQQGFSATPMKWADAKTWCSANTPALPGSGWRLPTVGELVTLVDRKRSNPAIDAVFSGTPNAYFWSITPFASGGSVWYVSFYYGNAAINDITNTYRVRCVR